MPPIFDKMSFFVLRVDTPSILCYYIGTQTNADLAHLVERDLAKVEVAGPSPVIRSIEKACASRRLFLWSYNYGLAFS